MSTMVAKVDPGPSGSPPSPPSRVLVLDVELAARLRASREADDSSRRDEVWDGVYVMSPLADQDHQWIVMSLGSALLDAVDVPGGDRVYPGINVSDRREGWAGNYRIPDVAVVLAGNPARVFGAALCGGPDLVVEILSPGDAAREKLAFYASVGVREALIVDRDPWALELYRLDGGELRLVGSLAAGATGALSSEVLPLTFGLGPGAGRPTIVVRRRDRDQSWTI